jgi:hypothetical protein
MEARSRNRCCRGKARSITYSECMSVSLIIQHSESMRLIILFPVASLAVPYFSTLSYKGHGFRKNVIVRKICALILSETFLRSIKGDMIIKVYWFSCKLPTFLSDINET